MRILYLSVAFPLPVNNGHRMRIWSVLEGLRAEGHEMTFLTFAEENDLKVDLTPLRKLCSRVGCVPMQLKRLSASTDYLSRLKSIFDKRPYAALRFVSAEMRAQIEKSLRDEKPDAIICDTVFSAVNLPETSVPLILNSPDVEHLILKRYISFEANPAKRVYASMEMQKVKRWETQICRRAKVCMACSEHDRAVLSELAPDTSAVFLPNVVDTDSYVPKFESNGSSLLFQGGMDWFPNPDAVDFFSTQILPLINKSVPDAVFVAAGRNPSPEMVARYANMPGVNLTGTVPDMRPYLEDAALCVVPLRIGSGTRLKILESAAAGKAIVSTRLGAEGLDFVEGKEIVLADSPADFAAAVVDLLQNEPKRRALAMAARERVVERYSYANLRQTLVRALSSIGGREPGQIHAKEARKEATVIS
jgi:glycosyltransferase involved in cell wall biosynthesis